MEQVKDILITKDVSKCLPEFSTICNKPREYNAHDIESML